MNGYVCLSGLSVSQLVHVYKEIQEDRSLRGKGPALIVICKRQCEEQKIIYCYCYLLPTETYKNALKMALYISFCIFVLSLTCIIANYEHAKLTVLYAICPSAKNMS